jgi:hypothetical protein
MPQLDLTDEEATAPLVELNRLIDSDRYPLSPRVRRFPLAPRIRCCAEFARSCRALRLNAAPGTTANRPAAPCVIPPLAPLDAADRDRDNGGGPLVRVVNKIFAAIVMGLVGWFVIGFR